MDALDNQKPINFLVVGEPLNNLLVAMGNKLSREWPTRYRGVEGGCELFVINIRVATLTYHSALFLCGDLPDDPRRLPQFCVTLPVLNRSILDILFTIIFILQDIPVRCGRFWEADWRETRLELDRYTAEYGHSAEWETWLRELSNHCTESMAFAKITPEKAANPSALQSWPNAGAMQSYGVSPLVPLTDVQRFLKYLHDCFYVDLSQQAHLSAWGMVKRGGFLTDGMRNLPTFDAMLKKNRYAYLGQTVAFVLALISEIEMHFNFGLRQEILYVWGVAAPVIAVVKEIYRKRYCDLLGAT